MTYSERILYPRRTDMLNCRLGTHAYPRNVDKTVPIVDGINLMRVLLASVHPQMVHALRFVLDQQPTMQVAGEVRHTADLLRAVTDTHPDILLLDWDLPGQPDASLLDSLHAAATQLKVIALGGTVRAGRAARYAGADAYINRGDPPERLMRHFWVSRHAETDDTECAIK